MEIHNENPRSSIARQPALTLKEFNGRILDPEVPIHLPWNLTAKEFTALLSEPEDCGSSLFPQYLPNFGFPALREWLSRLLNTLSTQEDACHPFHAHPYALHKLDVEAVDWFSQGRLGFMKIQSVIENDERDCNWIPGAVFLRGGSVAVLIIVQPEAATGDAEKHVILTIQPRIAACSLSFAEIPAGMVDDSGSLAGKAAEEIKEEAHLQVKENQLLNMSKLALSEVVTDDFSKAEALQDAMYPSPGGCDEFIPLFLCQKRLTRNHINWLKGRATGLRSEGEKINLKLVPLNDLWKEGGRDGKALAALALYEGLKREGKVPDMPAEVEREPEELHG